MRNFSIVTEVYKITLYDTDNLRFWHGNAVNNEKPVDTINRITGWDFEESEVKTSTTIKQAVV